MAIVINEQIFELKHLKGYQGDDTLRLQIKSKIKELQDRYFPKDDLTATVKVKYRTGVIKYNKKAKLKEGKKFVGIPLIVDVKTPDGTKTVRLAHTVVKQREGVYKYRPLRLAFRGKWIWDITHLEDLVWLTLFAPEFKSGLIVLEDLEKESNDKAEDRGKYAKLSFYLYHPTSPIFDDFEKVKDLCLAWGVSNVFRKSINMLKNNLYDAIEKAEVNKDEKYGVVAFNDAVTADNPFIEVMSKIQSAIQLTVIQFDYKSSTWKFLDDQKHELQSILRIDPTEQKKAKEVFAAWLNQNRDKLKLIEMGCKRKIEAIKGTKTTQADDKSVLKNVETVDDVEKPYDKNTDFDIMEWFEMRKAASLAGITTARKKKEDIRQKLKDFYSKVDKPEKKKSKDYFHLND